MTTNATAQKSDLSIVKRDSGVALLIFDSAAKYNSIGSTTVIELNNTLDLLERDSSIKAVIAISGKADSFVIGADLHEIRKTEKMDDMLSLAKRGQKALNRIATFAKPFVVAINGPCLGGGLEIALAAHARVATNSRKTVLGLPETRIGLIPGLGGCQRLPRLIGLKAALDMILGAEPVSTSKALKLKLIDELTESDQLIEAAESKALELSELPEWQELVASKRALLSFENSTESAVKAGPFCLADLTAEKADKLLSITERAVKLRTKGNYPAQIEAINAIRTGLKNGMPAGLEYESEAFARLALGEVAANLITLFFNSDLSRSSAVAMLDKFPEARVGKLAIAGAGTMGCGLAAVSASHGLEVQLKTREEKIGSLQESMKQMIHRLAVQLRSVSESDLQKPELIETRVSYVSDAQALNADMIVESVIEDKAAKAALLKELSSAASENCVIATNTSALSVTELARSVDHPENFLGLHFFHPIDRMPLVEVVAHAGTSKSTIARALDLVLKLDKTPLLVKDKPGFLINRLLTVYLFELGRMAEEGMPINWAEECMLEFGMPMGPLELMDEIGIDVAFSVAKNLEEGLGERMHSPDIFKRVCQVGLQGKRSNVGFYLWEGAEKKLGLNPSVPEKTGAVFVQEKCPAEEKSRITRRMIFAMVDESARCLSEKVVAKAREIDFALVLGIGFPAFRGGLLRYADQIGLPVVVKELEAIYKHSQDKGSAAERQVSELLRKYASEGRGFYSLSGSKESS